ncbi:metal-dependent hydrolase [Lachnoclostridium pacaense]|uniref:metal-dependent hydrolase n=1 Tax=Enterocloster hominis (ex Hitch et al. 2024) TaxID=1917870 RepID=UPI001D111993|nr:metal-dependent hydrolase [Lachnoclostridium pacaense]MCC2821012.1 metal-dependent hydrolase [Lachnoclostridium pacaense]
MNGTAHKLMGFFLGGVTISVVEPTLPVAGVVLGMAVLGELAPDIDTVNSTISLRIPIIPKLINRKFGHRGLLHSPLFLVLLWLVIGSRNFMGNVFCIGYLGHLVQDLFTCAGLPLLFPFDKKKISLFPYHSGGIMDYVITSILILLLLTVNQLI